MFSCFFQSGRQGTPQQALGQAHEPGPLLRVGGLQDLGEVCSSICAVSRGGGGREKVTPSPESSTDILQLWASFGRFLPGGNFTKNCTPSGLFSSSPPLIHTPINGPGGATSGFSSAGAARVFCRFAFLSFDVLFRCFSFFRFFFFFFFFLEERFFFPFWDLSCRKPCWVWEKTLEGNAYDHTHHTSFG